MNIDVHFMDEAIALALQKSRSGRNGPFAALVVRDSSVIGRGWNRVVERADPTAHAEVLAIRDACRRTRSHVLSGCTLYCTCEPCPMCMGALYWARIHRLVFACTRQDAADAGFDDNAIYRELARNPRTRRIPSRQIRRKQALTLFTDWTRNPRRVSY